MSLTKQFTVTNEEKTATFKFRWAFGSYNPNDRRLFLILCLTNIIGESAIVDSYEQCPEMKLVIDDVNKAFGSDDFERIDGNVCTFKYAFNDMTKVEFFIKKATEILRSNGVRASNVIDTLTAFPSVEYANDMLEYIFNSDTRATLDYITRRMAVAGQITEYKELFKAELPLTSDEKFNPEKEVEEDRVADVIADTFEQISQTITYVQGNLTLMESEFMINKDNDTNEQEEDKSMDSLGFLF